MRFVVVGILCLVALVESRATRREEASKPAGQQGPDVSEPIDTGIRTQEFPGCTKRSEGSILLLSLSERAIFVSVKFD